MQMILIGRISSENVIFLMSFIACAEEIVIKLANILRQSTCSSIVYYDTFAYGLWTCPLSFGKTKKSREFYFKSLVYENFSKCKICSDENPPDINLFATFWFGGITVPQPPPANLTFFFFLSEITIMLSNIRIEFLQCCTRLDDWNEWNVWHIAKIRP